jgi:hypothetical protein
MPLTHAHHASSTHDLHVDFADSLPASAQRVNEHPAEASSQPQDQEALKAMHRHALRDVLTRTAVIEAILQSEFKGKGRGIHSKVASSAYPIPPELAARLRYIGAVRNKAAYEPTFAIPDRANFIVMCDEAASELVLLSGRYRNCVGVKCGLRRSLVQLATAIWSGARLNRRNALAR